MGENVLFYTIIFPLFYVINKGCMSGKKRSILLLGSQGFLGKRILELYFKDKNDLWISSRSKIDNAVFKSVVLDLNDNFVKPEIIIHCARLNPYDDDPEKTKEIINNLVKLANENSIKLIYISSDAVFDGKKGFYTETDIPNPLTDYGKSKMAAEKAIREKCNNFIIIRTANIYGKSGGSYDKRTISLMDEVKLNKVAYRFSNVYRSFTFVDRLATACLELAESDFKGIINIAGPRRSFFKFNRDITKMIGLDLKVVKKTIFDGNNPLLALDTSLDTTLASKLKYL